MSPHGTRSRYGTGCRCIPCTDANTGYQKRRKTSRGGLVYARAARAHLRGLRDQGLTMEQIATLSGCDEVNLYRIINGQRERIQRSVEERILQARPGHVPQPRRLRPATVSIQVGRKPALSIFDELRILADAEPTWRSQGACRAPGVDPAWFFPGIGESDIAARAKQVCRSCPVQAECAEAGREEHHGIWGGLTERQRHRAEPYKRTSRTA